MFWYVVGGIALLLFVSNKSSADPEMKPRRRAWPVDTRDPRRLNVPRVVNGAVVENDKSDVDPEADRYFGADRQKGKRLHAGIDLIARPGDAILAMEDGVVLERLGGYVGLDALAIEHADHIAVYAEMGSGLAAGMRVKAGQRIGTAKASSVGTELHVELWERGRAPHGFTTWTPGARPEGLLDPTSYLLSLREFA